MGQAPTDDLVEVLRPGDHPEVPVYSRPVTPGADDVAPTLTRAELGDALDALLPTATGRAILVVVSGRDGMGKSELVTATARRWSARDEPPVVLSARAASWEAAHDLALLQQVAPGVEEVWGGDPFEAAAHVARSWVGTAGDAGLVVLLDDADSADPPSVQVLATTVRHHRDLPVLVVATTNPDRPTESGRLLAAMADVRMVLAPVGVEEATQVASRAGVALHASLAEHLVHHTGGRPGRIVDLLDTEPRDTWRGSVPTLSATALVRRQVEQAIADLDPEARALVEAVAVLDGAAPVPLAAAVADISDPLATIDPAERAGLLRRRHTPTSTDLEVTDPMTAAAVLRLMGPAREAELHRRASEQVSDDARRLLHAAQALFVPDDDLARELHALASSRAGEGAWAVAARLYQAASRASVDATAREERLLLAVDALVGAGDVPAASSYLAEVESLRETGMRNAVLGYLAILRGRRVEAQSRLDRAWQLESTGRHPTVAASIAHRHVLHHLARCEGADLVAWADRTVELVGPDHPTAVEAQAIRGLGLGSTGQLEEALENYRSLWGHASRGAVGQRVQMGAGWLHLAADDVDSARAQLSTAVPTDYLGGSTRISLWARAWLARTYFVSGDWDLALREAQVGLRLADRSGIALLRPLLQWTVTQVHALRGTHDPVRDAVPATSPSDYEIMRVPACLARAALGEARADYAAVLAALAPLTRDDVSPDVAEPGFWPWPDVFANALVMEGRLADADAFLLVHEARATERGHLSAQARLGYPRGRLLGAGGDLVAARRRFETSLEMLESLPLVYDRARVNFAYGQTLRRAGKRREADAVITAAREDWASLGAVAYVRRCDRELKAGGVAGTTRARPAEALTPQEQAVAALVSEGATNREAAAELFLSVKTVQFHLTRVYAKLGVRSRSALAALALDLGDGEEQ